MFIYQLLIISVVLGLSENMECRVNFETTTSEFIFITCQIKHFSAQQTYSVNVTSNSTRWDDAQTTKLKCTSLDDYWPVTCLLKVNTTKLESDFYGIEIIVSADVNISKGVTVDSYGIHIYAPNEPQNPECKIPNYNDVCSMNRKDRIESSYISCLAAVPFAKVNCSMIDTSKSTNVTITSYEAKPLLVYQNGIYTYTATCEIPFNATMLADGLNINITYSQVTDYDNTSLVSYSSASFSFRCPKELNFTVNASPDGVCVNIGENVTFRCDSDMSPPSDRIALTHGYTTSNFQGKDITLTIKDTSDYGNYMCSVGYSPYLLKKSVYVVAPEKALRRNQHTFYELHYTGKNNDTAFVLIGVTGCPEPITMTVLEKTDEDVQESNARILTKGLLVTYTRDPTLTWSPIVQYKLSGNINVTFLNKDMTDNLPEYSLNVSNGISYSVIDFGVYNSDALHLSHSTAVCLLCVVILQALLY